MAAEHTEWQSNFGHRSHFTVTQLNATGVPVGYRVRSGPLHNRHLDMVETFSAINPPARSESLYAADQFP